MGSSVYDLRHIRFTGAGSNSARPPHIGSLPLPSVGQQKEPLHPLISWVFQRAGLDVGQYRAEPLHRRIPACLRALHARDELHAREILEARPEWVTTALSSLLIGVTEFFRNPAVYDFLRQTALPALTSRVDRLRVWSIASASGAELYSVGILLAEMNRLPQSELFGTDCRADAIASARAGLYDERALRFVPPSLRQRYFLSEGPSWRIGPTLRASCRWKARNMFDGLETGPWDIILCRNVAIYLNPQAASTLWKNLYQILRPGGFLIAGDAEKPMISELIRVQRCIYRKNGDNLI
jgi:chemotaxis methyl-accepting protein methylase